MAKRKKPRPVNSYLKAVDKLAAFAPSLRKYKRRKKLNRWEKAAITRKEKIIGSTENLFAVSARQRKAMSKETRSAIIGKGVRAVRLRNTSSKATLRITRGEITTEERIKTKKKGKRRVRKIRYISVRPDLDVLIEKAIELFDRAERRSQIMTVWFWLDTGRAAGGFRSLRLLLEKLNDSWIPYALTQERFRGYAVLTE